MDWDIKNNEKWLCENTTSKNIIDNISKFNTAT